MSFKSRIEQYVILEARNQPQNNISYLLCKKNKLCIQTLFHYIFKQIKKSSIILNFILKLKQFTLTNDVSY